MSNCRLALGTVQFGLRYGISNQNGIPDDTALKAILASAKKCGIDLIDTAAAYGNAEKRLGDYTMENFRVVSKFPKGGDPRKNILASLSDLQLKQVFGYLAHDADDLIQNSWKWDELQLLKSEGLTQKTGFSLYHPSQLEECLTHGFVPDIVQLPFSILDRKFLPYFGELTKLGCEIHVRSVFLQGLYLMQPSDISEKLSPLRSALAEIRQIAENNQLTILELALSYVLGFPEIDRVVIGVDNQYQLAVNAGATEKVISPKTKNDLEQIRISNPDLLNPSTW